MAREKIKSAKYLKSLEEKYKENPSPLNYNSLQRAMDVEKLRDEAIQRVQAEVTAVKNLQDLGSYLSKYGGTIGNNYANGGKVHKYENGTWPPPEDEEDPYYKDTNEINPISLIDQSKTLEDEAISSAYAAQNLPKGGIQPLKNYKLSKDTTSILKEINKEKKDDVTKVDQEPYDFTLGDKIGLSGLATNMFGPMATTFASRATDKPNQNFYEQFGQDAISTLEGTKGFLGQQFKMQEAKVGEFARNGDEIWSYIRIICR